MSYFQEQIISRNKNLKEKEITDLDLHLHSLYRNLPDGTPTLEEKYPYYLYGLENDIEKMFNRE